MSVYVSVFGVVPNNMADGCRVLSLNIDTRHGDRFPVFDKAARAAKELRMAGFQLLINKIDSTLRGHAGLEARAGLSPEPADPGEIEAKGTWSGPRLALIAPSFPAMGRLVVDGLIKVNDELLSDSEVGRDPLSPVISSEISELVEANTGVVPSVIKLSDIREYGRLKDRIQGLLSEPPVLAVCDAANDDDLTRLASVVVAADGKIILSGSAGATTALARILRGSDNAPAPNATTGTGPTLIVSGSQRSVTEQQIELAFRSREVEWVRLNASELLDKTTAPGVRDGAVARLVDALLAGRSAVVSLSRERDDDVVTDANRTALVRELGAISYRVARRAIPGSLVLIGGDTSQGALRAIGAAGIVLHAEPFPGVPSGVIHEGLLDGVSVISKAGAFGDEDVIIKVMDYLRQP